MLRLICYFVIFFLRFSTCDRQKPNSILFVFASFEIMLNLMILNLIKLKWNFQRFYCQFSIVHRRLIEVRMMQIELMFACVCLFIRLCITFNDALPTQNELFKEKNKHFFNWYVSSNRINLLCSMTLHIYLCFCVSCEARAFYCFVILSFPIFKMRCFGSIEATRKTNWIFILYFCFWNYVIKLHYELESLLLMFFFVSFSPWLRNHRRSQMPPCVCMFSTHNHPKQ